MPSITVQTRSVFYQSQAGTLPASLVLLHGSGSSHQVWRQQMSLDFNLITLDLPGHGLSSGPPGASILESVSLAAALLEKINPPRPLFLGGHSLGAAITLGSALGCPKLIDGIIVIGGGARLKILPDILHKLAQGEADPEFIRMAFSPSSPADLVAVEEATFMNCPTSTLYSDLNSCDQFDIRDRLGQIHLPALMITGQQDRLTPIKYAEYLKTNLPRAELAIIENAGHFVMLEQPVRVNLCITEFISKFL